jgi:hypothetical protein
MKGLHATQHKKRKAVTIGTALLLLRLSYIAYCLLSSVSSVSGRCCSVCVSVGSGRSHGVTCHLHRAYDNVLACSELETLEGELADLDALAQAQTGDIDVEVLRDLLIRSCDVDLADREVHAATVANTLCQTVELDGDADGDRLLIVDLVEVDVQRSVGDGVELDLLENSRVILTVDSDLDNVDVRSVNHFAQLAEGRCESKSRGLAIGVFGLTIEVARDETFLTEGFRSFLTKGFALLT